MNRFWVMTFIFGSMALMVVGPLISQSHKQPATRPPASIEEFLNSKDVNDRATAIVLCEKAFAGRTKFGKPQFPSVSFSRAINTADAQREFPAGKITLVEPNTQVPNAFGSAANGSVLCHYDWRAREVLSVSFVPR